MKHRLLAELLIRNLLANAHHFKVKQVLIIRRRDIFCRSNGINLSTKLYTVETGLYNTGLSDLSNYPSLLCIFLQNSLSLQKIRIIRHRVIPNLSNYPTQTPWSLDVFSIVFFYRDYPTFYVNYEDFTIKYKIPRKVILLLEGLELDFNTISLS